MLYIRGNKKDFDKWQSAGNQRWSWDDCLPYFKKSENNLTPKIAANKEYHGTEGPLKIDLYHSDSKMKRLLADCFREMGFKEITDFNSNKFLGFGQSQGNIAYGARYSIAKGFLNKNIIENRTNLHITKHAHVTKLKFDKKDKTVKAIEFTLNGKVVKAAVKKEVVLSAGSINTPQILMLSGIGPKKQLDKHQIRVLKDLQGVGRNLQDHSITPLILTFQNINSDENFSTKFLTDLFQYSVLRTGPLSNLGTTDYMGFISTTNDSTYPDIQILNFMFGKESTATVQHLLNLFNYNDKISESIVKANKNADLLMIFVTLLNPKSRGHIELRSSNPFDAPKIFPNYLSEKEDLETILRGFKIIQNITMTKAFQRHGGSVVDINLKKCQKFSSSDDFLRCYIRHMSVTLYHPVGTAKMGPDTDEYAVVDSTLKLKGLNGIRVADASIMSDIVSANPNAATVMIGERVADFIKEKWSRSLNKDEL